MMQPSCDKILELAGDYDVIPVCKEIYADVITPITLLRKLANISKCYYLLESIEGGEKWGRYSFLGFNPVMRVFCKMMRLPSRGMGLWKKLVRKSPLR